MLTVLKLVWYSKCSINAVVTALLPPTKRMQTWLSLPWEQDGRVGSGFTSSDTVCGINFYKLARISPPFHVPKHTLTHTHSHPSLPFLHCLWVWLFHGWDWCGWKNERSSVMNVLPAWQNPNVTCRLPCPLCQTLHGVLCRILPLQLSGAGCQVYFVKGFRKIQINCAVCPETAKPIFSIFTVLDNFI